MFYIMFSFANFLCLLTVVIWKGHFLFSKATLGIIFMFFKEYAWKVHSYIWSIEHMFLLLLVTPLAIALVWEGKAPLREWEWVSASNHSTGGSGDKRCCSDGICARTVLQWYILNARADGRGKCMCTTRWHPTGSLCTGQTAGSPPFLLLQMARKAQKWAIDPFPGKSKVRMGRGAAGAS